MSDPREAKAIEHIDVLIVGAGLSGIGAAYYLQRDHPRKSYAILEARGATGGTWDLFRYPGIRSDSDLYTFGYEFAPWESDKGIADGPSILAYIRDTARTHGIDRKVRLNHKVVRAAWSSADARWRVEIERTDTGERLVMTAWWIFSATGYYRYDQGYTPHFEGRDRFPGRIIHPQQWPEDLDYAGKRVAIIGSGATAVTLVPAMAETAAHVTMIQRTPTYVLPLPSEDAGAKLLRKYLPKGLAHELARKKNIARQRAIWKFCRNFPRAARRWIRWVNVKSLPDGYPVDEHFSPPYDPWDQRLCLAADGDLFQAIKRGRASIVTDHVDTFTERGVRLRSGREVEADIIITATGLALLPFGGVEVTVDGAPVRLPEKVAFRGMMLDGVPNLAFAVGYTNASWTLKIGLLCEHFCRLLAHMDARGYAICRPERRDRDMPTRPLLDFGAGYVKRALDQLPRQGTKPPWVMSLDYSEDVKLAEASAVEHEDLHFSRAPSR